MFSHYPHTYTTARKRRSKTGFTLIELLMVVAVIMILAGITFGVSRGVQNAQARARAKADLAVLSQALEAYKSVHGDYPWAEDAEQLVEALLGWRTFERVGNAVEFKELTSSDVPATGPKSFIDPTVLSLLGTLPTTATQAPTGVKFIDPWANEYIYKYKKGNGSDWEVFGYLLYSKGGDSVESTAGFDATTGVTTNAYRDADANLDNIYSGE